MINRRGFLSTTAALPLAALAIKDGDTPRQRGYYIEGVDGNWTPWEKFNHPIGHAVIKSSTEGLMVNITRWPGGDIEAELITPHYAGVLHTWEMKVVQDGDVASLSGEFGPYAAYCMVTFEKEKLVNSRHYFAFAPGGLVDAKTLEDMLEDLDESHE